MNRSTSKPQSPNFQGALYIITAALNGLTMHFMEESSAMLVSFCGYALLSACWLPETKTVFMSSIVKAAQFIRYNGVLAYYAKTCFVPYFFGSL